MADGSIVISTELDNKDLERQLSKVKREIEKMEQTTKDQAAKKSPLVAQAQELEQKMRAARAEAEKYGSEWAAGVAGADKNQSAAVISAQQLEAQHAKVVEQIDKIDARLGPANGKLDAMKEAAGGLEQQLVAASGGASALAPALNKADMYMNKFVSRVKGLARRVFVFTIITAALRSLRDWFGKVVKTNSDATAAMGRLKGALLTLAQPLVDVIVPAFTAFANVLADIVGMVASVISTMAGTTVEKSAEAAEELHEEQESIEGVGKAAEEAAKSMAGFDEINKISGESKSSKKQNGEIAPDFSGVGNTDWLKDTLGDAADLVTAALLLGGIALVAIGASMGSLPLVTSGLLLIGAGITTGAATGALQSWADALGLNDVREFVLVAVTLGGIALVALGAAFGNIFLVLAGLGLIWGAIAYSQSSGTMGSWTEEQMSRAATYITAALLLGGIALVAIGAATANILMVLAGLGLLAAGVYVGLKSGTLKSWAEVLGLDTVFDYVVAAIQLVGIVLIVIGAAMANIFMVLAGAALLAVGILAENVGEETLKSWWEVLQLTSIQQWVSVAFLLVGIVLIAIGAAMANLLMVVAGAALIGLGVVVGGQNDNLKDWVETLGLEKVVGWVTAALMLAGMAFVVFGILTANVLMVVAGIGLLGAGIAVGTESGTFKSWVDALGLQDVPGWVSTALLLAGIALVAIGAMTLNPLLIIAGLGLLGAGAVIKGANYSAKHAQGAQAVQARNAAIPSIAPYDVPALAQGAVIPANREFLAVLGDQKSGTNIEAPLSTIKQAMVEAMAESGMTGAGKPGGDIILQIDGVKFARITNPYYAKETRRVGVSLTKGV